MSAGKAWKYVLLAAFATVLLGSLLHAAGIIVINPWLQGAKDINPFLGTWKLISVTQDTVPPSETENLFGNHPSGFLNYSDDGRMMVIIAQAERPIPAGKITNAEEVIALYRTMNSYAGTYTIKDDYIIHHIDISWNQKWTGTDQTRHYQFKNDRLILSLPPVEEEGRTVVDRLTWVKMPSLIEPERLEQAVISLLSKTKDEMHRLGKSAVINNLIKNSIEVFVLNNDGMFLASPAHPEFIGTNQWDYQDASGAFAVREEIEKAKAGGGWLKGRWRFNPEAQEYGCRKIYIMPVTEDFLIGSWYFYPFNKEISKANQQAVCGTL